jgi:hypothetical protein
MLELGRLPMDRICTHQGVGVREAARTALEIRDAAAAEARPLREHFLREAGEHPIAAQLTAKALGLEPQESKSKSSIPLLATQAF